MKIAFIGGGNMAEAMLSAILAQKLASAGDISVSDIAEARRDYIRQKYGVSVNGDNRLTVQDKEIVILAIKPQVLAQVMEGLKGRLKPSQLVISIIAGKNIATLRGGLAHDNIVRSMPNTPAQIGEGMTVWSATPQVSPAQRKEAASILSAMGIEIFADEEKYLDMATAVSGSGPAYVFLFAESLMSAAEKLGFTPEISQKMVMQTLLGSIHLLKGSGQPPQELRRRVTSPGGTTAAAIAAFEQGKFQELVAEAVSAAYEKAKVLGSQH
jgi:pyrroline-5-carboxylate reductase